MQQLLSIYSEYKNGSANLAVVAERHGMSHAELLEQFTRSKHKLPVKKAEIYKAELDKGESIEEIAKRHGVQSKTVKTFLRRHQYEVPLPRSRDSMLFSVATRHVKAYRALGIDLFRTTLQKLVEHPETIAIENIGVTEEPSALALAGVLTRTDIKLIDRLSEQVRLPSGMKSGRSLIVRQVIEHMIEVGQVNNLIGDEFSKLPGWEPRPHALRQGGDNPVVKLKEPAWNTSVMLPLYLLNYLKSIELPKPRGHAHIENEMDLSRFVREAIDSCDLKTLFNFAPVEQHVRAWARTIGGAGLVLYRRQKKAICQLKQATGMNQSDVIAAIIIQKLNLEQSTLTDWNLWEAFVACKGNPIRAAGAVNMSVKEFIERLNSSGYVVASYEAYLNKRNSVSGQRSI